MTREDAIQALMGAGRTREQAEAYLDILGSAFRRRGWAEGEPLSEEQLSDRFDTFMGPALSGGDLTEHLGDEVAYPDE